MTILGISGSPNLNGNTATALKYALEIIDQAEHSTIYRSLANLKIGHCIGCFRCSGSGECWQNDDMEALLKLMTECDGIIMASPVYFGMVSGQLKTMMDRCVPLRVKTADVFALTGKMGAAIACGNSRNGGQETTLQNIQTFMMQQNMMVISDGPPYCHAGGTIMGDTNKDQWGLETVRNVAENISRHLRALSSKG